ncbi:DUF2945 domain-containing protein [Marivita sp. S0852]|uniref:DUF2945 domain-containing protein n=1 Tax=Marivita sp. S0852 TaxID=3373893 RepID=UPI003981D567
MAIQIGDTVTWEWGNGTAEGSVTQIYTQKVTKTIKGTGVTRHASEKEPAYLIEQSDGDEVLKSCTEVQKA